MTRGRVVAGVVLAVALQTGLAIRATWPLATAMRTHLPGVAPVQQGDVVYAAWALSWTLHALGTAPARVGQAPVYHPARDALYYGPPGFALVPVAAPLALLGDEPVWRLDAALLAALALTAAGLHVVVWRWTGSWAGGALAGAVLFLLPTPVPFVLSAPQYAALAAEPPLMLALARPRGAGGAVVVALLAAWLCLVDLAYVAPTVLLALAVLALLRLARPATRSSGGWLLAALAGALVLLAPVAAGYARVRAANPDLLAQTYWVRALAAARAAPLASRLRLLDGASALLPLVGAGLAAHVASRGRADRTPAAAWGQAALWIGVGVAAAAWLVDVVPALAVARVPERLAWTSVVGVALAVGLAAVETSRWLATDGQLGRWAAPIVFAVAALCLLGMRSRDDVPLFAVEPAAESAALESGSGPVLELPAGTDGTAPLPNALAMLRALAHGRPLLNGYASYYPAGYVERMHLADDLPDPGVAARLRAATGLDTVVVHLAGAFGEYARRWRAAWSEPPAPLRPLFRTDDTLVFRVVDGASGP
jgi:hypothetical protein